jgi:hypothetical protein
MKIIAILLLVGALVGGCSPSKPPITVVHVDPLSSLPAECVSVDPAWIDLPDAPARRNDGARNYRTNKDQYEAVLGARDVCRSAIKAGSADKAPAR